MTAARWILAALALWAFLAWGAHRMRFHPMRHPDGDWRAQERLGALDIGLTAWDGVKLHGWWVQPENPRTATLFLHGNAGNVTHRADSFEALRQAGSAVLCIDYRGYGKSEGSPSEPGLYRDAEAAYQVLRQRGWAAERIVLHGESLGTAVAVELATRVPAAGVVLEAPFPSLQAVAREVLPVIGPLLIWGFDSGSRIANIKAPLLVIHGRRDDIIPYPLGEQLFAAARAPKRLVALETAGHNDIASAGGAPYRDALRDFHVSLGR
jgi:hypothetical protein